MFWRFLCLCTACSFGLTVASAQEIFFEAEAAEITAPMEINDWAEASGGQFIAVGGGRNSKQVPPDVGGARYEFTVKGGVYQIFGRVIVAGGGDDSFWVRIEGAQTNTRNHASGWIQWNRIAIGDEWHWDAIHSTNDDNTIVKFTLAPGTHTLEIRYLEDSTLLDALVITDQLDTDEEQLPGDLTGKAYSPSPSYGEVDVDLGALSWTAGLEAVASRVYLSQASFDAAELVAESPATSYQFKLSPGSDYYWRVDSVRADGSVVTGHPWKFLAKGRKPPTGPIDIGSRRELMVDDFLIERLVGAARKKIHHPTPQEVVMVFDESWEGNGCGYHSIFKDGDVYRMYYRGWQHTWHDDGSMTRPHHPLTLYAESRDGIHWEKPELGLIEFEGSKKNNIVFSYGMADTSLDSGHVTVFRDDNPRCPPQQRYKAIARALAPKGLMAWASADGLSFSPMQRENVIGEPGTFDSQNTVFWDPARKEYRCFYRYYRKGVRDIRTCTSEDFVNWSDPVFLKYPGAPSEHLYTNAIQAYYRAPHIFVGFPARYSPRGWSKSMAALPDPEHRRMRLDGKYRYGAALSDVLLMSSRDGEVFHRWDEAFLRPGPERVNSWAYSDHYLSWPVIETKSVLEGAPPELSFYAGEGYWTGTSSQLRRYTMRLDGFASVNAPFRGGEMITWPLTFSGRQLELNFASSAAGDIRVELQDAAGKPLPGYALEDCPPIFGDSLERVVDWEKSSDVSEFAGQPVRLRFVLRDADLFSFRFRTK